MNPYTRTHDQVHILYDADTCGQVDEHWFDPEYWRARHALTGRAHGRGTTWFVRDDDRALVLRHYLRGGKLARLLRDRYPWWGLRFTRAWREWHLLAHMTQLGLPVPHPVAARVVRHGVSYTADLITQRIADASSLAQRLSHRPLVPAVWSAIGVCIRRFHDVGIDHADLNAHNILLDHRNEVHLIDFDRGRQRIPGPWQARNLARLQRSLNKLKAQLPGFAYSEADWRALEQGYRAERRPSP